MKNCVFIGNIGCGKSSWVDAFHHHGFQVVKENLDEIYFLQDYWTSGRYAFHAQVGFYATWFNLYNTANLLRGAFMDSSILSHHMIFTEYMHDNALLAEKEYRVCQQLFDAIWSNVQCHNVFLHCSLEENLSRVEKRARKFEIKNREFICMLYNKYNELYYKIQDEMLFIDITNLSPQSDDDFKLFCNELVEGGLNLDSCIGRT